MVTIIGMAFGGPHRWSDPFQQLGWIFFIAGFLVMYMLTGREITRPRLANLAWLAGVVSIVLFLVALIFNVASDIYKSWFEAFEAAASIAMVVTVISAIWSAGGWERSS